MYILRLYFNLKGDIFVGGKKRKNNPKINTGVNLFNFVPSNAAINQ